MNRATPEMRRIAKALLDFESSNDNAEASTAFHVAEKLRPRLANMMGIGGFRALLLRALVLASAEAPWLVKVRADKNGTLEGMERKQLQLDQTDFLEGSVIMLAHLLGLLVALIGLPLTLRYIHDDWPDITPAMLILADEETQDAPPQ